MPSVLITGINGFIGQAIFKRLRSENYHVLGTVRSKDYMDIDVLQIESIGPNTDWTKPLINVNTVVHLAAIVPIIKDTASDPLTLYRKVNVLGTGNLARQAALANVRRFIYMSSVAVNGKGRSKPYNEEDIPKPQDAYSISKWEAEKVLNKISGKTGMELVIIRSPLVYGPGVKANFLHLLKVVDRGIPLPLANANNSRSLIYLENLVDAIITCMKHPKAAGQTYFVSDGYDISTPELIRRISFSLGRPARLFPFPPLMLKIGGVITRKSSAIDSLLRSLTIDCSKIRRDLNWQAPFSMSQALRETAKWYMKKDVQ